MNGYRQEGFGCMDMTVHAGRRVNTADAYLGDAARRPNLEIRTGAQAAGLAFDGRRCRGVRYTVGGVAETVYAEREVVLAAGAIGSPHLLMLSGIGDADELRAAGVTPRHHLPGVGRNLQDHLEVFIQYRCTRPMTLASTSQSLTRAFVGARWLLTRSGWGATNHFESGGFIRSSDDVAWPDIQFHFLPRAVRPNGRHEPEVEGFQANVATMRSKSRGTIKLRSDRHDEHPVIDPRYMSRPEDWFEMRQGIRHARALFAQPAFDPYRGEELTPGAAAVSDAELDAFVRAHAMTGYHPCGACKMGSGPDAVVDGELKVHGLEGLRVADSSIMPQIVTGNLNASSIMIGEKAADLIRGSRLPPIYAPVEGLSEAAVKPFTRVTSICEPRNRVAPREFEGGPVPIDAFTACGVLGNGGPSRR
jgi:choline dehydrogenase